MTVTNNQIVLSGFALFMLASISGCNQTRQSKIFDNPYPDINELAITSDDCILEGRHIWVNNEIQTVNPDFEGTGGISKIYSPPLNLSPFAMEVFFFGRKAEVEHYVCNERELLFESIDGKIRIVSENRELIRDGTRLKGDISLGPGKVKQIVIITSCHGTDGMEDPDWHSVGAEEMVGKAREKWNRRLGYAYAHLGRIKTSNPDFDLFYKRGILSLLTCEWNYLLRYKTNQNIKR